jgi:hypothetical protein
MVPVKLSSSRIAQAAILSKLMARLITGKTQADAGKMRRNSGAGMKRGRPRSRSLFFHDATRAFY